LATAVGTAALAMGLSAPANAVVLGGDNGWEVSFTGTINLFYQYVDTETTTFNANSQAIGRIFTRVVCTSSVTTGGACFPAAATTTTRVVPGGTPSSSSGQSSKLHEGLLPAFATFKAKSPTVNGLTGTAQISFAPDSNQSKTARQNVGGNQSIDMREVFFNVDGSFGTISAGRTLGMFQRQAILKDQTLFGVGASGLDSGGTTLGRIGTGYVYPAFETRFAYTTPNINGFQLEVGVYNPLHPTFSGSYESDVPGFQGELNYKTTFGGGNIHAFAGGLWNEFEDLASGDDVTSWGWNAGLDVTYGGFNIWGHYYSGEALGSDLKWFGGSSNFYPSFDTNVRGSAGQVGLAGGAPGFMCWDETDDASNRGCAEADNDGFVVQGSYTFNGKTKIAASYGESNQDSSGQVNTPDFFRIGFNDVEHSMWTVGIYHDVTPWLKVVAEYNNYEQECEYGGYDPNLGGGDPGDPCGEFDADNFSVGGFIFW
ncbi:MAG: porin, partial [Gammaproteobacteria bacterium]